MSERTPSAASELACPFADLVEKRVLGDVSPEEDARLEAHLAAGCPLCAPRLEEQDHLERLIMGAFRPLEHEIERRRGHVLDKVKEGLARDDARQHARRRRRVGVNSVFFFVVLLGLLLIAAEYVGINAAYRGVIGKALTQQGQTEVHALAVAILRYYAEKRTLPPEGTGLATSLGASRDGSDRPYFAADPRRVRDGQILDPWNRPYVYRVKPGGFDIFSLGSNGKADGQGPHDIARWVGLPPLPQPSPSPSPK